MKTLATAFFLVLTFAFALSACSGKSAESPAAPPEDYMSQAEDIANDLNEAAKNGEYYTEESGMPSISANEPQLTPEPPPTPADTTRPPRADQIIELKQHPYDLWGKIGGGGPVFDRKLPEDATTRPEKAISGWNSISTNFRSGWLPSNTNEFHVANWSLKSGLSSSMHNMAREIMRVRSGPTERHPDIPLTYKTTRAISAAYQFSSYDEEEIHWKNKPVFVEPVEGDDWLYVKTLGDWQAFIDEELQRFGFILFMNGVSAPVGNEEVSKDDYVMLWFVFDDQNNILSLWFPAIPE
jgi:hypothetical protein